VCVCVRVLQPPNGKPISEQLQKKINDILRSRGHTVD